MQSFIKQLALVSEVKSIKLKEVARVAAALDKQATRDFGPIWGTRASIHAFEHLEDVPLGYWPLIIKENIRMSGAAGIHLDKDGQPFALITAGDEWSLTASHEALEILADPFGNRTIPGPSIKPDQGRVNYLVEVCDPSEDSDFAYTVNDVVVSDFYTPSYFDPTTSQGVRYSFTGAISKPREVLKGGYLSWHEPVSGDWWQATYFGAKLNYRNIGPIDASKGSLRSQIDAVSVLETLKAMSMTKSILTASAKKLVLGDESAAARAKSLAQQIDTIIINAKGK